jgi:hypothetical protein
LADRPLCASMRKPSWPGVVNSCLSCVVLRTAGCAFVVQADFLAPAPAAGAAVLRERASAAATVQATQKQVDYR